MGSTRAHEPVKLIIGFIYKKKEDLNKVKLELKKLFGEIDFESRKLIFNLTDYYEKEFGKGLKRCFISFNKLISPSGLSGIKAATNRIEKRTLKGNCRLVNIDPGYLNLSKLVLASTKDFRHRIYLSKGIFAEITLFYQNKTFQPWEWTYPDYRTQDYLNIFNRIREIYGEQIDKRK